VSPTAIALILIAAVAHASWNLFSKQAATTGAAFFIWLISACITVGYAPVVALAVIIGHAHLTGPNWVFMAGTGVLQAAYFLLLQIGYGLGDLSVVYPVGRGTGAMLAAVGGIVILGERPSAITIAGIVAIVAGVVVIGLPGTAPATGIRDAGAATSGTRKTETGTVSPGAADASAASNYLTSIISHTSGAPSKIGAIFQAYLPRKRPDHGPRPDESQPQARPGRREAGRQPAGGRTRHPGRSPASVPGKHCPSTADAGPSASGRRTAGTKTAGTKTAGTKTAGPGTAGTEGRALGGVLFALATGVFIASYTIWDKYAVANLHTPSILQGYACYPVMTAVFAPFVLRDRRHLEEVWRAFRPQVLGAALLAPLAYILVLTALSFTAVSAVAPAREVSVLFGVLLGRRLLGESNLARRLTAAAAIVAGIIAIAVG